MSERQTTSAMQATTTKAFPLSFSLHWGTLMPTWTTSGIVAFHANHSPFGVKSCVFAVRAKVKNGDCVTMTIPLFGSINPLLATIILYVLCAVIFTSVIAPNVGVVLFRRGRVKNRWVALLAGVGIGLLFSGVAEIVIFCSLIVWKSLIPSAVQNVLLIVGAIVGIAALILILIASVVDFFTSYNIRTDTQAVADRILDDLQQRMAVQENPEVTLTIEVLRSELDKQNRAAFRQSLALTVIFSIASLLAGAGLSLLMQSWASR